MHWILRLWPQGSRRASCWPGAEDGPGVLDGPLVEDDLPAMDPGFISTLDHPPGHVQRNLEHGPMLIDGSAFTTSNN